jgi:hypothetical protein
MIDGEAVACGEDGKDELSMQTILTIGLDIARDPRRCMSDACRLL